ncbi:aldehyde dehydrogenase family protein [Rhodobacterales bacterium]|nr:aldehyde dehydrogenase family protein [Rhodobacterales bacterium]
MNINDILAGKPLKGLPSGHYICGRFVPGENATMMESFDPGRGEAFAQFTNGSATDVDTAVESARSAFLGIWRKTAASERAQVLLQAARLIREHAECLAIVETLDCGKPLNESLGDIRGAARAFEYYAGACDKLQGDTFPLPRGYLGYSTYEPVGVTAHVIPWNFPISTTARSLAPALAAGCTVVAKPAEQTPLTALMLAELLSKAGLPNGVCNVVTGTGADVGAPLVAHPDVDQVTFTGSVPTGQSVMRAAADNVTRVVLELGGKSPVVVLNDCDWDRSIDGVLGAIFENAGQVCSAGSRLVIERGIHDRFVEELVTRTKAMTIGHGLRDPQFGPVNSAAQLEKVAGFIDRARSRGAEVLTGGKVTSDPETGKGWFYEPTIIADRPSDDELVQEEIFGPVLTVQIAEDPAHALALANDSKYGLVAGIYTQDVSNALAMARDIDAGQIFINEYFAGGIEVPFGGNKLSGFGREKGLEGLKSYCKVKSVAAWID